MRTAEHACVKEELETVSVSLLAAMIAALACLIVGSLVKRQRADRLPDCTDEQFLAQYYEAYAGDPRDVLKARRELASVFRVSPTKLMPEQSIDELEV